MAKEKLEKVDITTAEKAEKFLEKNVQFNEDGSVTSPEVHLWNLYEASRYFEEQKRLVLEKIREETNPVIKEVSDLLLNAWSFDKNWLNESELNFLIDFMQKYGIWKPSNFISDIVEDFIKHISTWDTVPFYERIELKDDEESIVGTNKIDDKFSQWSYVRNKLSNNNRKLDIIKDCILKGYETCNFLDAVNLAIKKSNKRLYEEEKNKFYVKLEKEKSKSINIHLL